VLGEDGVDVLEGANIGHVDANLEHVVHVGATSLEDGLDVGDTGFGLFADGTLHERAIRLARDLARDVDETPIQWSNGSRNIGSGHGIRLVSGDPLDSVRRHLVRDVMIDAEPVKIG